MSESDVSPRWLPASALNVIATVSNPAFQSVLDHVPGAWFFTRADGTFAYVNQGAATSLGYSRAELASATIFQIDPTMTAEIWRALWADTPIMDSRIIATRHRRRDGSEFPVEVRCARLMLEGEDLAASYTVDMTASRNTELNNRRLLAAIEQANEAVVVTDASGRVDYVNPAYVRSAGRRDADVRGVPWLDLEARDDEGLARAFAAVLATGASWRGRIESRRDDGRTYNEDVSLSPMRDDAGHLVGCVAVKRDVTEQLRLEQQLLQTQRIKAVGQLAGGIAHDFNNLLQVIYAQTELLALRAGQTTLQPMLHEIHKAVDRATNLVRQLLAFSRKGTVEFSDVRLDQLVSLMYEMLQPLLGAQIEIEWENAAGATHVRGNAPQLEQVVANLCINARDAMPRGGKLRLALESVAADALPARERRPEPVEHVLLSVTDNGVGMDSAVQSHLFEPFFTTKEPGKGTGLGLATVHAVVEAHAGFIEVHSSPGEGSTFRVFLPRIASAALSAEPARRAYHVHGRDRWVLVAEDEPAVRELAVAYLERAGFRVLAAKDGVEADGLLRDCRHDVQLAVLDAVMPRRGGQAVRAGLQERGQDIPILFVTGYDFESLADAVNQPGVAILQKPFSADDLLAQVAQLLGEADTQASALTTAD